MSLRFKIVLAGLILILTAGVLLLFSGTNKPISNSLQISNLGSCSKNINPEVEATLSAQIYTYVKTANSYNHAQNNASYTAQIRKDSCRQAGSTTSENNTVTTTSAILDIPVAKQSWKITWAWVPSNQALSTDVGAATAECLPVNELIYGGFHCANALSLVQYGTPYYDPILKYVPYSGSSFDIAYSPANKLVTVTVLVPVVWASDPSVAQNIESAVPVWFTQNGLSISNYTVNYLVAPQTSSQ